MNPAEHPRAWGMTLFMGVFLNMLYWSFRLIKQRRMPEAALKNTAG
jgi:cbb3-type cytochrome oxidase subunit 3